MPAGFYDYVRGLSEQVPAGYSAAGMRVYRHLVYLGASQMVDAGFPGLRDGMGEAAWRLLIEGFVRQSAWTSHFYGDLQNEFRDFVSRAAA